MATQKKIGNRLVIFGIVLLLSVNVFAQEASIYKDSDQVLLEKVEKYLNSISFFDRIFLNIVIKKIDPPDSNYIRLDRDVPVRLLINNKIDCDIAYFVDYIDPTDLRDATIFITSGFFLILQNEAELVASIAHELGHLSSLRERIYRDTTKEEYLKNEIAADRMGTLVAKQMGYNPGELAELYKRIPSEDSATTHWIYRFLAIKKLVKEIYEAEPENKDKYKEYLYFTETQFKEMQKIVEYLQQKSGT